MSKDKYNAPQGSDSEFVDEILAEARKMRGNVTEELDDQDIPLAQARPVGNMYKQTKKPAEPVPKPKPVVNPPKMPVQKRKRNVLVKKIVRK